MHSLALMMPAWLMCISLFHYTVVLHRFQHGFDTLTPSVIQQLVTTQFSNDQLQFSMHPPIMEPGIKDYFSRQFAGKVHDYQVNCIFFNADQQTICFNHCQGVNTSLSFMLYGQTFSFHRHYQLVMR